MTQYLQFDIETNYDYNAATGNILRNPISFLDILVSSRDLFSFSRILISY